MAWEGSTSRGFPPAVRRRILQRDPVCTCTGCRACTNGCTRPSTEANHIVPAAEGGSDHETNGNGLCSPCHTQETAAQAARGRQRPSKRRPIEDHPGHRP